jgi:hypothetical protein
MKLHIRVCCETLWHFESKERLGEVFVCCIKEYTNRMLFLIKMLVVSSILFGWCLFTCRELFLSDPYHFTLLGLRVATSNMSLDV